MPCEIAAINRGTYVAAALTIVRAYLRGRFAGGLQTVRQLHSLVTNGPQPIGVAR